MSGRNLIFQTVRLPKGAPSDVREQFIGIIVAARTRFPAEKSRAAVIKQLDRVGTAQAPIVLVPQLMALVKPYVVVCRQSRLRKRETPQT